MGKYTYLVQVSSYHAYLRCQRDSWQVGATTIWQAALEAGETFDPAVELTRQLDARRDGLSGRDVRTGRGCWTRARCCMIVVSATPISPSDAS